MNHFKDQILIRLRKQPDLDAEALGLTSARSPSIWVTQ